ncbi:unnamed protein product [Microthlaspi erraticum]|uniref:Reverse transcriptase zinc-binding domain-containing protein n=1 Tax=Microthlaspi erraticum TaxID=1685480 RepID=A0A6D2HJ86_9BRAS|nr:unnamed protein product [Microthlaspi erraticum]
MGIPTSQRIDRTRGDGLYEDRAIHSKSGYTIAQEAMDADNMIQFGPDVRRLQAQAWKIPCTQKLQHFLWQILTGCISGGSTLRSRGLGLSPIPTAVNRFPTEGLFTNMAHLFWNLPDDDRMRMYPWLIWFIWKARNDKVFSNGDWDPI